MRYAKHPLRLVRRGLVMLLAAALTSCGVQQTQQTSALDTDARWAMLPVANHSQTVQAGKRAGTVVATLLRSRGVDLADYERPAGSDSDLPELDERKRQQQARAWAREQGFDYGVTGSVAEWRYKSGLNGQPAVGLTLRVIDLNSGETIWSATGADTGWGRESLAGTGHELASELIAGLPLTRP